MKAVAYIELAIMGRVLLGALFFRNSFLTPVFYAHFLRQRYHQSAFTRSAVADVKSHVDKYVQRPGTPPVAVQVWERLQQFLTQWVGHVGAARPAAGPAPAAARAQ